MSGTILIGLHGKKGSGKNTAADVIHEWGRKRGLKVLDHGFADLLKFSCIRALGIDVKTVNDGVVIADSLKRIGDISISIPEQSMLVEISGRQYLQNYGTEAHRDVFGRDFWIDQLLPLETTWQYKWAEHEEDWPDIAVITDLRYANEAQRIHQLGGEVWLIDWPSVDDGDTHSSEQQLPDPFINAIIINDSTLEGFQTEVNSWMTANFHMNFVEKPDPV